MGVSKSFAEFEKKAKKAAAQIDTRSDKEIIKPAALKAKRLITVEVAKAAPSMRMNVGKNGQRLRVYYVLLRNGETAVVQVRGPIHLLENPTKPHIIGAGRSRTASGRKFKNEAAGRLRTERAAKKAGRKFLSSGKGGTFKATGPVKHPGTKGKGPFAKGVKAFRPQAPKLLERGTDAMMRKVF